jgi:hypothetical protein
MDTVPS